MRGLRGKAIAVIGGGGIGGATAQRLAEEGARVAIGDIDLAGAEAIAGRINAAGGMAISRRCDIADERSIADFIAATVGEFDGLDGLHANAADMEAVRSDKDVLSTPMEVFDRTVQADLRGHILCTRIALPELLKRGGGALVYTSSESALRGAENVYAYSSAKAGLIPLARHVAFTWGRQGIRANVIAPGAVLTETLKRGAKPEMLDAFRAISCSTRLGQPEDIAAMAAFLLSDDAIWINGQTINVNGGSLMR